MINPKAYICLRSLGLVFVYLLGCNLWVPEIPFLIRMSSYIWRFQPYQIINAKNVILVKVWFCMPRTLRHAVSIWLLWRLKTELRSVTQMLHAYMTEVVNILYVASYLSAEELSTVCVITQEENNCKLVPDVTWTPPFAEFNLDPFTIIKL